MRVQSSLLASLVASLLISAPVLAAESAPQPQAPAGECHGGKGGKKHGRWGHKGRHLDRAVQEGRLTQAQADQFKAEARQLREEFKAQRQASGGQLSDAQKEQFKQRRQALRAKVKAALGEPASGA
jgi:periplasmic protein CpxP/Spy